MWSSERLEAALLGFWTALPRPSRGVPVGSRTPRGTPATQYPARLRTTPQACRRASSPRHVDEQRSAELAGLGERLLLVHACHLLMVQLVSFGDREPPDRALLAELWRVIPPQPSEQPVLPAVRRRGFVLSIAKQSRDSEIHSRAVE